MSETLANLIGSSTFSDVEDARQFVSWFLSRLLVTEWDEKRYDEAKAIVEQADKDAAEGVQ